MTGEWFEISYFVGLFSGSMGREFSSDIFVLEIFAAQRQELFS
jgi:hypothetical protein